MQKKDKRRPLAVRILDEHRDQLKELREVNKRSNTQLIEIWIAKAYADLERKQTSRVNP